MANDCSYLVAEKVARQVFLGRLKQIVKNCSPTPGKTVRLSIARSEMPPLSTGGQVPVSCRDLCKGKVCKKHRRFLLPKLQTEEKLDGGCIGAGQSVAVIPFQLKP